MVQVRSIDSIHICINVLDCIHCIHALCIKDKSTLIFMRLDAHHFEKICEMTTH